MNFARFRLMGVLAALMGTMMLGCSDNNEHGDHDGHDGHEEHEGEEHDAHKDEAPAMKIEGLSGDDLKIAQAQKICPVSDQKLGSMGTPIKVEHDGKVVFLCCKMCKPKFEKDPKPYMAKLKH